MRRKFKYSTFNPKQTLKWHSEVLGFVFILHLPSWRYCDKNNRYVKKLEKQQQQQQLKATIVSYCKRKRNNSKHSCSEKLPIFTLEEPVASATRAVKVILEPIHLAVKSHLVWKSGDSIRWGTRLNHTVNLVSFWLSASRAFFPHQWIKHLMMITHVQSHHYKWKTKDHTGSCVFY